MLSASELRAYAQQHNLTLGNDFGASTDWQKEVQRTAFTHNHNVSISGGSESTTYNASINYMDRQGVIKGTDMDRLIGTRFCTDQSIERPSDIVHELECQHHEQLFRRNRRRQHQCI